MAAKIGVIILALLALGGVIYLYHLGFSGGLKAPSWLGSSSSGVSIFGGSGGFSGPSLPTIGSENGSSANGGGNYGAGTTTINPSEIPAGFTVAQLSPYFHQVRFGGVSYGGFSYYGTITLNANFSSNATGSVDITGWQIKSRNSGEYVPQAINLYDPSGLSAPSDIVLRNGDAAYLYSSAAPYNLRLNKCIGYIAHMANFNPPLPTTCPVPDRSQIQGFTGSCQNYIQSLTSCTAPDLSNPQIPRTDYACQSYLENNFTYRSCFAAHVSDADFLSNQVWAWMGGNVIDQYHDTVNLFDRNGLLVDQYAY